MRLRGEHMQSVLIVSSSEKSTDMLVQLLKADSSPQISTVGNGAEARRVLINNDYDLVVVNSPLTDEFGHELAIRVTEDTTAAVVLLVKAEIADQVSAKVEDFGVLVVTKPINRLMFYQAVKLACASRRRILGFHNENLKLQSKIEEIRLVDRAKCALIQYLSFTEQQAHRHIEKQAMDMRITKKEVALGILKTYEI